MSYKPTTPKGTRDFCPTEMSRRNYLFTIIKNTFKLYGFLPIETPAMENMDTLMGKYGEEGDRLIFKILNSGNYLEKFSLSTKEIDEITKDKSPANEWFLFNHKVDSTKHLSEISEKALRYDLTVPFARYVVQHQNEITFPFKRYQIQPVWRADRPQKGRYREFYQCDADIIGSDALLNEVELVKLIDHVFTKISMPVTIKINNRKILGGIAEIAGQPEKITDITVAIDKLDKIGQEKVIEEMQSKGISNEAIQAIKPLLNFKGNFQEKISLLFNLFESSEIGKKGIEEIKYVIETLNHLTNIQSEVDFDITLARGLNYYTGAIFEVKAKNVQIGSICGGGRYDDLTGIFGLKNVSGVGISFGIDRIYDAMNELGLFEKANLLSESTLVLFINFGEKETNYCLQTVFKLREKGVNSEMYPDTAKLKKQMKYANDKNIPYVVIAGEDEIKEQTFTLKKMDTGEQKSLSETELINLFKTV
ncbi:MAG: histidine--tRNA ligase [Bacteroidetes bacterium]|nr:histidine--tRNA ligase [Bacteroidota bacterium]MBV6461578.1 Histidine--tRNA ligase [Flavobacteriales bacterium]WKZ74058.1 MAG: histidine--tRNA ligase [Vicingaceae bacterium]MCL4817192.1 histidine--tRNA ligase [Flavobacteriales bacterium]NOG95853.1 histidine--tRNA ligase [Bacteroidota bacterium]